MGDVRPWQRSIRLNGQQFGLPPIHHKPALRLALVMNLIHALRQLKSKCLCTLPVEQNVHFALSIIDYAYVMQAAPITLQGPANQIAAEDAPQAAYLGMQALFRRSRQTSRSHAQGRCKNATNRM